LEAHATPGGSGLRVRFLGHATLAVSLDGVTLLTDPLLRRRVVHLRHHALEAPTLRHTPDAVLISHIHQDHLDFPSLKRIGRDVPVIVPPGAGRLLRRRGFPHTQELEAGEVTRVGEVEVTATPARHHGWRPPFGPTAQCNGFVVAGSRRVYFAGDTDLFPEMLDLGPIDVALLPVWGWGPTLGAGHLDPRSAAEALALIRPRIAVPIHWGALFPLGLGRWRHHFLTRPPLRFAAYARRRAPDVDVRVLQPGETLFMPADPSP